MSRAYDYIQDGAAIYERSFAIIRAEADLARFSGTAERVVVRMIHACGMTDLPADVEMSAGFAELAQAALRSGAPILCDAKMVANGVTRARLPAGNEVVCTLDDPQVPALAAAMGTTRSAAAMELWKSKLAGCGGIEGGAGPGRARALRRRARTARRFGDGGGRRQCAGAGQGIGAWARQQGPCSTASGSGRAHQI